MSTNRPQPIREVLLCAVACAALLGAMGCATLSQTPEPVIDDERNPLIVIETNRGSMTAELFERDVRNAVAYFVYLIESRAYNQRAFYKADAKTVESGPQGKPIGFRVKAMAGRSHLTHTLSIKGDGKGYLTADFMILRTDALSLDEGNTVVGRLVSGQRTLSRIQVGDRIERIYLKRRKDHAYAPTVESDGPIRPNAP